MGQAVDLVALFLPVHDTAPVGQSYGTMSLPAVDQRAAQTAMTRTALSRPIQIAAEDGVLSSDRSVFDYGCGRGDDIERLREIGYAVSGWDPAHAPDQPKLAADVVNLGFVINVIEQPTERVQAVREAWSLAKRALIVSARPDWEAPQVTGRPHGDGIVTSRGTFQKFFGQDELRSWLEAVLDTSPVAASPGVFYVFRDPADAAGIRARRYRRRPGIPRPRQADLLWNEHKVILEPLASFWEERGRLPVDGELSEAPAIVETIGSLKRAAGVIRRALGDEQLAEASRLAGDDLLVFLALEAFRGRPRFTELPDDIAADVKAQFGSYKTACTEADQLLFGMADEERLDGALRSIPFGKVLPDAVYVHHDYIDRLPPLVRVYEGAGRALLGEVEDTTIVKMSRRERRISYLSYPRFERDPHPALATSLRADLRTFYVKWRDFRDSANPPILHRKETFVPEHHPTREKFAKLTRQEERAGLYEDPSRIGTRQGWTEALATAGKALRGHRLVNVDPTSLSDRLDPPTTWS